MGHAARHLLAGPAVAAGGPYDVAVAADHPTHWWKMGDASGTSLADSAGTTPATTFGTVTFGQPGINGSPSKAALFAAGAGAAQTGAAYPGGYPVSMETWFKTTARAYVGANGNPSGPFLTFGTTGTYSPSFGLGSNTSGVGQGKILGYSYPSNVTTPADYNDGNWHHAVLTITGGGAAIVYLDGAPIVSGTLAFNGFSATWDIANAAGGSDLVGTLAHGAVYEGVVLSAAQILNHYNAGH